MTSCPDWADRLIAGQSIIAPPLFPEEAKAALDIFCSLKVADIPGCPRFGDVARPWILEFVSAVFGAYDQSTKRQMIREYFLLVSKKNSKSTLAAGIMMTALIRNPRQSATFLILAPTKEIAGNSFGPAADMATRLNEELAEIGSPPLFRIYRRERRILNLITFSELKVIAADAEAVGGTKATAVLIDELWLFGKRSNTMSMFREALGGLASRPEGFVVYLSTMSDEAPAGEFLSKLQYARKVRDGEIRDPGFLPVIYEFPQYMIEDESYRDPNNWFITNPNLGASVDLDFLKREFVKARDTGEAELRDFEAKHLNVEISSFLRSDKWAAAAIWHRGAGGPKTLDEVLERSEVVTVGIDGGGLDDLFGIAVLGRERITKKWLAWAHALIGPEGLERRKANVVIYEQFRKAGEMTFVESLPQDISFAVEIVQKCIDAGLLSCVGIDPMTVGGIIDALAEIDVTEHNRMLVGVPQGIRLMNAAKTVERKLADGTFLHSNGPLLQWCVSNVRVRLTSTAMILERSVSGYGKIDPVIALLNAAHLMTFNPEAKAARSFWESYA